MGDSNARSQSGLRRAFRLLNHFMVLMWRMGLGRFGNRRQVGGQILVIAHTGRKTGKRRLTPVNYAIVDGEIYCTSGFGRDADWYQNLQQTPEAELWLPDGRWSGSAVDVTGSPQGPEILREVLIASGFAAFLAGIHPWKIKRAELEKLLETYRLIRFQRREALTGPDGPGDLAWIWPVSTLVLGVLWMRRRRLSSSG